MRLFGGVVLGAFLLGGGSAHASSALKQKSIALIQKMHQDHVTTLEEEGFSIRISRSWMNNGSLDAHVERTNEKGPPISRHFTIRSDGTIDAGGTSQRFTNRSEQTFFETFFTSRKADGTERKHSRGAKGRWATAEATALTNLWVTMLGDNQRISTRSPAKMRTYLALLLNDPSLESLPLEKVKRFMKEADAVHGFDKKHFTGAKASVPTVSAEDVKAMDEALGPKEEPKQETKDLLRGLLKDVDWLK